MTTKKQTANDAYLAAHLEAQKMVKKIETLLFDLPAPDDDEHPLNWGHVGNMQETNSRLKAVIAFLTGTED